MKLGVSSPEAILYMNNVSPKAIAEAFRFYGSTMLNHIEYISDVFNGDLSEILPELVEHSWWLCTRPRFIKFLDEETCFRLVKKDPGNVSRLPRKHRTERVKIAAVKKAGKILASIPKHERSKSVCKAAIQKSGSAVQWVPDDVLDQELCNLALEKGHSNLKYIPKEFQTSHLKMKALIKHKNAGLYIKGK